MRKLVKLAVTALAAVGAQKVYSNYKLKSLPAPDPATRVTGIPAPAGYPR